VVLRDHGLAHALRSFSMTSAIPVNVIDKGIGRCSASVEAAVYFCALEAVQNAIKHAGAGARVRVMLRRDPPGIRFEVADDGVGMDVPTHTSGTGLIGMRDRIGSVGGKLEIASAPGQGTTVRGAVPDPSPRP
jgi:signal transduction histidine kinase